VTCRCGRSPAHWSERLGRPVCWRCYHCSFTDAELAEARRFERQRGLAQVIRGVAERAKGRRRQMLRDRAVLIELAEHEDEVIELVDEVRALGVRLEVKR
jgi:hypothetical protein